MPCIATSFQRAQDRRVGGGGGHFTAEKPGEHYLSWVIKVAAAVISHVDSLYPWQDVMKMAFGLSGLAPTNT